MQPKKSDSEHYKQFQELFSSSKEEPEERLSKGQKRRQEKKNKVQRKRQFTEYLSEKRKKKKNADNLNLGQLGQDLDVIA